MTQEQRLNYLLEALLAERGQDGEAVPAQVGEKRRLLRALFNLAPGRWRRTRRFCGCRTLI